MLILALSMQRRRLVLLLPCYDSLGAAIMALDLLEIKESLFLKPFSRKEQQISAKEQKMHFCKGGPKLSSLQLLVASVLQGMGAHRLCLCGKPSCGRPFPVLLALVLNYLHQWLQRNSERVA